MTVAELIEAIKRMRPATISYNDRATVTLQAGIMNVVVKHDTAGEPPLVNLADRLTEILGLSVQPGYQPVELDYAYQAGSETARYGQHLNVSFSGRYHPNVACEGQGVCTWCGCVL